MRREPGRQATKIRWLGWLAVPALACVVPLVVGQEQRNGDGKSDAKQDAKDDAQETEAGQQGDGDNGGENLVEEGFPVAKKVPLEPVKRTDKLVDDPRPRQSPFFLTLPDERTIVGCLEWEPGKGDRIVLREVTAVGKDAKNAEFGAVCATPAEIIRPIGALDSAGRIHVFWTELVAGTPQLRYSRRDGESFIEPVTLTSGPLTNMNVEAALHADGRIYVAWESEVAPAAGKVRGSRDVLLAPLIEDEKGGKLGDAIGVGVSPSSDIDPVVVSAGGKLWLAWSAYTGRDYDVRMRSFDPANGKLDDVVEISADGASDDLHPALAVAPNGDPWVAWDRVEVPARGASAPFYLRLEKREELIDVSVRCACVHEGNVLAPKAGEGRPAGIIDGAPLMSTGGGAPHILFDRAGVLWIAYRYLLRFGQRERDGFPVLLQRLGPKGWSIPFDFDPSIGSPEEPSLAAAADGVLVAFQCDRRFELKTPRQRETLPKTMEAALKKESIGVLRWMGAVGIGLGHVERAADAPAGMPELVERASHLDTPHWHPVGNFLSDPLITGEKHHEVVRGDQKWSVYYGELHRHSSISRCSRGVEPGPADRWSAGRDVMLCDFMAMTDHSGQTDPFSWWQLDKLCWLYRSPTFCTLAGWEWSTVVYGHQNVILRGRMSPLVSPEGSLDDLYAKLPLGECVAIPHHSSDANFPNDFPACDDRFSRLIEVYQAKRGNYEFDGCFKQATNARVETCFAQEALNQGHKFGIIASTDHGLGQSYACALARRLDTESIFEALHERRTFGATQKGMFIDFRVNDALMGEEVQCNGAAKLKLVARGMNELADVVVFKNGRVFKSVNRGSELANHLTPGRLVVHLPSKVEGPEKDWTLTVSAPPRIRVEPLDDASRFRKRKAHPEFAVHGQRAVLTWPAGFKTGPFTSVYAVHFRGEGDCDFTVETPDGTRTVRYSELLAAPLKGPAPGGEWSLGIELNDGVVDLAKGLGTKEFTAEWDDPDQHRGARWYYARFIQTDGEICWSSPVFVTRGPK